MADDLLRREAEELTSLLPRLLRRLFTLQADDPSATLSLAQVRLCTLLFQEPLSMSSVSRELGISLSAVTQIADRLEAAGFVRRVTQADDRRVKVLRLTAKARRMMTARDEMRVARAVQVLAQLSPEERRDALTALQRLADAGAAVPLEGI